ncbi:hypothetical protein ABH920_004685 [Catenulispora sp. EB89]|uniref:hypothetical protein n=1 Tax=Catenulispora sp. EB89 TaxID=3156257 RepID=UPI003514D2DF
MAKLRKAATALAVCAAALGGTVGVTGSASANPGQWYLQRGQTLNPGDSLYQDVPNGGYLQLIMQTDGNLVEYHHFGSTFWACWSTNTWGRGHTDYVTYQQDGNFVMYDENTKGVDWESHTKGVGGTIVNMSPLKNTADNGTVRVGMIFVGNHLIGDSGCVY